MQELVKEDQPLLDNPKVIELPSKAEKQKFSTLCLTFRDNFSNVADVCFNSTFADLTIVYPKLQQKDAIFSGIFFKNETMRKMCDGRFGDYDQQTKQLTITQEEDEEPFRYLLQSLLYNHYNGSQFCDSFFRNDFLRYHFGTNLSIQWCLGVDYNRFATFSVDTLKILMQYGRLLACSCKIELLIRWLKYDKVNRVAELGTLLSLLQFELSLTDRVPFLLYQLYKESENQANVAILETFFAFFHLAIPKQLTFHADSFFIHKRTLPSSYTSEKSWLVQSNITLQTSTTILLTAIKLSNPIQSQLEAMKSYASITLRVYRSSLKEKHLIEEVTVSLALDGGETTVPVHKLLRKDSLYSIESASPNIEYWFKKKYLTDTKYSMLNTESIVILIDEYQFSGFKFQPYTMEQ